MIPSIFSPTYVHLRWMIRRDLPEVLAIESATARTPWDEEELLSTLRRRDCHAKVAERDGRVVGFMVYLLPRGAVELVRFAVLPRECRAGIGSQMMDKLAGLIASHPATRLVVTVRESNLAGQLFLRSQGFRATRVLRGHFVDSREDGYRMEYQVSTTVLKETHHE